MIALHPDCPASVPLLADHLDTALAIGEDLAVETLAPRADLDEQDPVAAPDAIEDFVRRLRRLEAGLLLRILQARRLAMDIAKGDAALKAAGALFRAQTELLSAMMLSAQDLGDHASASVDVHAYLRSRGLLAPEAAAPSPYEAISVTDEFKLGGVAPLGVTLDLVSSLLDVLDARFGLYAA
ncbi:MAG: hypothetical protein JSS20_14795, partial [Proteobacteria bacterium]|nr:hypothetical protein [Pseudomonadota bacterium]